MRRFWIFFVFMFLVSVGYETSNYLGDLLKSEDATYSIYTNQSIEMEGIEVVSLGFGYIISSDTVNGQYLYDRLKNNSYGQSVSLKGNLNDCYAIINLLGVKVLESEHFDNIYNIYGEGDFGEKVDVNGAKVNIQIAYRSGMITIGCPIILGSY